MSSGCGPRIMIDRRRLDVQYGVQGCLENMMRETTFTELRTHAKRYFDAVENGESVRVYRNGKPVAEIVPVRSGSPSWKRVATPLIVKGVALSGELLSDRKKSA